MDSLFPLWGDAPSPCGSMTWSRSGIGSGRPGYDAEASLWVAMRPSIFLALATPLPAPRASLTWLRNQVAAGAVIHPPVLDVWCSGGADLPAVVRHDGRHRTMVARDVLDDGLMPVLIGLFGPGARAGWIPVMKRARLGMRAQRGPAVLAAPLFEREAVEDGLQPITGIPPPGHRDLIAREIQYATCLVSHSSGGVHRIRYGYCSRALLWRPPTSISSAPMGLGAFQLVL